MDITELTYPVFEANQVLTNAHLNDLFEYLDEQTRLTRANLIGIGIACGLEVQLTAPGTIRLSKGVGVTSEGYLILEPADVDLVAVRPYTLPTEYGYPPFIEPHSNPATQFDLWELFADDDEPGAELLATSPLVLDDKALVLFLELRKSGLRNCSPNNCDDRGAEVTAVVRRLMIDVADLDQLIAATSGLATASLGADLTERLALPDLRMPRFDVPNDRPVTAEEVLAAFHDTFRQNRLVTATAGAFDALYGTFKPLIADLYPANPFIGFVNRFGFLDTAPVTTGQARFMQYFWDLFDDLIAAYDELRWKGVDLLCACCPPAGLFPRHLMAGLLDPSGKDAADYRHHWVPSPAVGNCEASTVEVRQLFERLVTMIAAFTERPPTDPIRATPSRWGEVPLSGKAIPYYYAHEDTPPLYERWDPAKTTRKRANQNLSYRAGEFRPTAPTFVTDPLRFDLEPNNFLRVEGHLGKNVHAVLQELLTLRRDRRLPIDIVALRTGAFDENFEIDLSKEQCRFEDLETLYETLRVELICFLVKQVQYFYDLPHAPIPGADQPVVPSMQLLRTWAPDYRVKPATMGRWIETVLGWQFALRFIGLIAGDAVSNAVFSLTAAMSELANRISEDVRQLDFAMFANRYQNLVAFAKQFDLVRTETGYDQPGLSDRLDDIVFRCRLDPFDALADEYKRRVREVRQAQFLGHFLERHPGIQHKAGVPLGGTLVLVYHELPTPAPTPVPGGVRLPPVIIPPRPVFDPAGLIIDAADVIVDPADLIDEASADTTEAANAFLGLDDAKLSAVQLALTKFQYKPELVLDPDVQLVFKLVTGRDLIAKLSRLTVARDTFVRAVGELANGAVIADFFLPYQFSSVCAPIQYSLPPLRLRVEAAKACTNVDGLAEVTLTTLGATQPLAAQVDGQAFEETTGTLLLGVGTHTIVVRDATGAESSPVEITIPPQLVISATETVIDERAGTYNVAFALAGGTPPYVADVGSIVDATYTSPVLPVAEVLAVTVTDAAGCTVRGTFESGIEPCQLPCDGAAIRSAYRFWVPEARPRLPLSQYGVDVAEFKLLDHVGNEIDLTAEVATAISTPAAIAVTEFPDVVKRWITRINTIVADKVGSDQWLRFEYEGAPAPATTGTLWIDRLACIDFVFDLVVVFVQGRKERKLGLRYDSKGTLVMEPNAATEAFIRSFGGSLSNKCKPDERPVPLCEGVEFNLKIRRDGVLPGEVFLSAEPPGPEQPADYLWEIQDAIPALATGERVVLTFDPPEPTQKLVRLTAFSEAGCIEVLEEVIDITKIDG